VKVFRRGGCNGIRSHRLKVKNREKLWTFREKLMKCYQRFESDVETLCQEYDVKVNMWYEPSNIPQPKFVFEKITLEADTLYDEEVFGILFPPEKGQEVVKPQTKRRSRRQKKREIIPIF